MNPGWSLDDFLVLTKPKDKGLELWTEVRRQQISAKQGARKTNISQHADLYAEGREGSPLLASLQNVPRLGGKSQYFFSEYPKMLFGIFPPQPQRKAGPSQGVCASLDGKPEASLESLLLFIGFRQTWQPLQTQQLGGGTAFFKKRRTLLRSHNFFFTLFHPPTPQNPHLLSDLQEANCVRNQGESSSKPACGMWNGKTSHRVCGKPWG